MQGNTQISDAMVEAALDAYQNAEGSPLEGPPDVCMRAALSAALAGHVVGWREITEDDEPQRDVEWLLGWWRTWPGPKWEMSAGLYGSTKGGWVHGQATHYMPLPAPAQREG